MRIFLSLSLLAVVFCHCMAQPSSDGMIRVSTDAIDLVLAVGSDGRLYQAYLGPKLLHDEELQHFAKNRGWEAYSTSGNEDYFEPALGITHADGNMTTYLYYVDSSQGKVDGGTHTRVTMRDDRYPLTVVLSMHRPCYISVVSPTG